MQYNNHKLYTLCTVLPVFRTSTISYTLYSVASVQNLNLSDSEHVSCYHVHCALCNIVAVNYSTVFDLFEQYNNHKLLAVFDMLCAWSYVEYLRVTQHKITLHKTTLRLSYQYLLPRDQHLMQRIRYLRQGDQYLTS